MKIKKALGISLLVFGFFSLSLFLFSFSLQDESNKEFKKILNNSSLSNGAFPEELYTLAKISEGKARLNSYVAQIIGSKWWNKYEEKPNSLGWVLNYFLLDLRFKFNFSEREIFIVWCELAPVYNGVRGMNIVSKKLFKKKLNSISLKEKAELVVIAKGGRNLQASSLLKEKVAKLIEDYEIIVSRVSH